MSSTDVSNPAPRGRSSPKMRTAECKDCRREVAAGKREPGTQFFAYPEAWADGQLDRGGSRTDRCREHRQKHQQHIAGLSVAYIDLATVGEVSDRQNPTGPLGGLGPLPEAHRLAEAEGVDLGKFGFGMDESHIRKMLASLVDPDRRVLIVKAGTGTGKSTYMPYRLLDPPAGCFRLADLGPIVVTEPRVQATVGVAEFVGLKMSGAGGVGPGFPVGYQVSGNRNHDAACQLIYVTDGTMINWLREGRLSQIGTVIVDEAHERSTNIDFIMGYLKRELPRYPHLRVIVTSATFDADFYQQYFGGEKVAGKIDVPPVKSIGYGWPLFPELDTFLEDEAGLADKWEKIAPELKVASDLDEGRLVSSFWPPEAPALKEGECEPADIGYVEDLHETTRKLLPLRFRVEDRIPVGQWKAKMPEVLGQYVVRLAKGLDAAGIYGDILGFLPTGKNIEQACEIIRAGLGERADVFALLSTLPAEDKANALAARRKGDKRKIVVSTNLAETSLTVEGVRFVVDSGLIAQSEWDPDVAQGGIRTKAHSQAGIKQRWGRVGRKAPGWVFPLYTKGQLIELAEDTAPGSTRDNLEQLVMTAKMGGVDDVVNFPWPAAFEPAPPVYLDETAKEAQQVFLKELARANEALRTGGAIDGAGHPTSFGKELTRFQALGSTACAIAVMYADRLACVPEVVTILALLNEIPMAGPTGLLLDRYDWPDEWRFEAAERHRAIASACEDDAELVLQICAGWERADPGRAPWEPSAERQAWARSWWVNDEALRDAAEQRRDILAALSPAMKEEVKRFIEPALLKRARGAISRALAGLQYRRSENGTYQPVREDEADPQAAIAVVDPSCMLEVVPARVIPLMRRQAPSGDTQQLANLVAFETWAVDVDEPTAPTGPADAMRILALSAMHARADTSKNVLGAVLDAWPAGRRVKLRFRPITDALLRLRLASLRWEFGSSPADLSMGDVTAVLDPAALPAVEIEDAGAIREEGQSSEETGAPEDAHPEQDTSWPSAVKPIEDAEAKAARALLDSREVEAAEAACGQCDECLLGRPGDCLEPVHTDAANAQDALRVWRERATLRIDVSTPLVKVLEGPGREDIWYEVCGYEFAENQAPIVRLRPDWRPPGDTRCPGEHPDLSGGEHVDVMVGPIVRDHRGELRILNRADGKGRFLLREAPASADRQEEQGHLAISLNRQHQGLLHRLVEGAALTVTAIPRKEAGCVTVTLLELLYQHFTAVNAAIVQQFPVQRRDGTTMHLPFYPALVAGEPNRSGYADVELLGQDRERGIVHGAAIFAGGPAEGVGRNPRSVRLGDAIYLRLNRETAKLSLNGLPLPTVRALAEQEKALILSHEDPDEDDADSMEHASDATEGVTDGGIGMLGSRLLSRGPVPRAALDTLLALNPAREWESQVWQFWARSRHLRTDRQDPYREGTQTESVQRAAVLAAELPQAVSVSLDEARRRYPRGAKVQAIVENVREDMGRAWLRLSDGVAATAGTRDLLIPNGEPLDTLLASGVAVSATVTDVVEHRGEAQVRLRVELPGTQQPQRAAQLTLEEVVGRYPRGRQVEATVESVRDEVGRAWLRLPDGVQATVVSADVGTHGVIRLGGVLAEGQAVYAVVKEVSEHRGNIQVRLDLRRMATKPYPEQLAEVGVRAGSRIPGKVANVSESLGVFVEVAPGTNGLAHVSTLPGRNVAAYRIGQTVTVDVIKVEDDPRRPGRVKIGLRMS